MRRLAAVAALVAVALVPGASSADATMKNCTRSTSLTTMEQRCQYSSFPNPYTVWQRVVVLCDGMWPITDYTARGNWAKSGQPSTAYCDNFRTPRYQGTEVGT